MNLTIGQIERQYERIVTRAQKAADRQQVDKACFELHNAATIAYHINFRYTDARCESMIEQIGRVVLGGRAAVDFNPTDGRIVFYDAFSLDNRGLTQQYIRALISKGYEFLYIFGGGYDLSQGGCIAAELAAYRGASVTHIDQGLSSSQKVHAIYDAVAGYAPHKALLHIAPWSVEALAAFSALPNLERFNINLTDHAFWLGSSIFDFNIEFRHYGAIVSIDRRGLREDQLLLLPFYPIIGGKSFAGFPSIAHGRTVIFSGGAFYKVYGGDGIYFDLVKRILAENPNTVLLFAGSGDSGQFDKFIKTNNLVDRVALLGNRDDIGSLWPNVDIYLGTYPFAGGLMSQLAAVNGVPIAAYNQQRLATNNLEEIVCHNRQQKITDNDLELFFEHVQRLCSDPAERQRVGSGLRGCVIEPSQFADELDYILKNNRSQHEPVGERIEIDYDALSALYLETENRFAPQIKLFIVSRYKLRAAILFPRLALAVLPHMLKKVLSKIV